MESEVDVHSNKAFFSYTGVDCQNDQQKHRRIEW